MEFKDASGLAKKVFFMRNSLRMSWVEIARLLGMTPGTAANAYRSARNRGYLGPEDMDDDDQYFEYRHQLAGMDMHASTERFIGYLGESTT